METFQCFLRSGRLLLKDIIMRLFLKENVLLIFFYVVDCAASGNTSMFIKEHATASERYQCERNYAAAS